MQSLAWKRPLPLAVPMLAESRLSFGQWVEARSKAGAAVAEVDDDIERLLAARRRASQRETAGFCPNCGGPIQKSDRFCPKCGATVT